MGAYVTQANLTPGLLTSRDLVQLTQDVATATTVDDDVLEAVIVQAEAEVDGYLGARFALPLQTVPNLVVGLAARVTKYRLYTRRPGTISESLQADYDAAIATLKMLAQGSVTLGAQPEPPPNPDRIVRQTSGVRVMGRSNLGDY